MNTLAVEIFLVEDNPSDVRWMQEVLKEAPMRSRLTVARDGEEAVAFLTQEGGYANAPRPDLIVLDLNLPKKDGVEVLTAIMEQDRLKDIPVAILTSSVDEQDVDNTFSLKANCYITKPIDLDRLCMMLSSVEPSIQGTNSH